MLTAPRADFPAENDQLQTLRPTLRVESSSMGGGMPIRAKGSIVGGIGVSGAPGGDADDACARAGIRAVSDALELE